MKLPVEIKNYKSLRMLWRESLGKPLAIINGVLLGFTLLALVILPWVQTSRGTGKVSAFNPNDREQKIDSPIEGKIARWNVNEGSEVKLNDVIAEMSDFDPEFFPRLRSERDALAKRLSAAQQATLTAKKNLDRQKELFDEGLSAKREYEKAEIDYMGYLASEASASAELTRIDTRLSRQSNQFIRAPRGGVISRILVREGNEVVKAGNIIAVLVPKAVQRSVELFMDAVDLPLVQPGQTVRLQFEGWPSIQFSGWPSVAVGTFPGKVANVDPSVDPQGKFRILVIEEPNSPWPEEQYLRQGMRARGWVQLGVVRLGYELWRNFNGFPASIEKPSKTIEKK
jgi:multidrug efflux pump subunit AcrA (membrane-fusion protein)